MINSLDEFKAYQKAMELGGGVWKEVSNWEFFDKDTIGNQLVRSCDSIAANLSEGLGRYHYKEVKNFSYYARGSLFETRTWLTKTRERNLISNEQFEKFAESLDQIGKMINGYIKSIGNVNEPDEMYGSSTPSNA